MKTRNSVSKRTQYMDAAVVGMSAIGGLAFSPWAAGLLATIAAALLLKAVFNIQDPQPEPAWKVAARLRETRPLRKTDGMDDDDGLLHTYMTASGWSAWDDD